MYLKSVDKKTSIKVLDDAVIFNTTNNKYKELNGKYLKKGDVTVEIIIDRFFK